MGAHGGQGTLGGWGALWIREHMGLEVHKVGEHMGSTQGWRAHRAKQHVKSGITQGQGTLRFQEHTGSGSGSKWSTWVVGSTEVQRICGQEAFKVRSTQGGEHRFLLLFFLRLLLLFLPRAAELSERTEALWMLALSRSDSSRSSSSLCGEGDHELPWGVGWVRCCPCSISSPQGAIAQGAAHLSAPLSCPPLFHILHSAQVPQHPSGLPQETHSPGSLPRAESVNGPGQSVCLPTAPNRRTPLPFSRELATGTNCNISCAEPE